MIVDPWQLHELWGVKMKISLQLLNAVVEIFDMITIWDWKIFHCDVMKFARKLLNK